MVPPRPRPPLPEPHRARHRQAPRSVSRIPHAAGAATCTACRTRSRPSTPSSSSPWRRRARFSIRSRFPQAPQVAVLGDGKARPAGRAGAPGARRAGAPLRPPRGEDAHRGGGRRRRLTPTRRHPSARYDWVVDATGSAEDCAGGGDAAAARDRHPEIHGARVVPIDTAPVIVNEITLVGSRCGRFEPALELLALGTVPVERMICGPLPARRSARAPSSAPRRRVS